MALLSALLLVEPQHYCTPVCNALLLSQAMQHVWLCEVLGYCSVEILGVPHGSAGKACNACTSLVEPTRAFKLVLCSLCRKAVLTPQACQQCVCMPAACFRAFDVTKCLQGFSVVTCMIVFVSY